MDPTADHSDAIRADWQDQHRQDGLIATSVVFTVLSAIIVGLRFFCRFFLIRNYGVDDYLMMGAMILTIGYLIDIFVGRNNHMGFPATMLTLDNMTAIIKATLAIQVTYYATIFCIKTSILFTYLRFALSRTFRLLCIGTIVLHTVFFLICFIVTLAQCKPLSKMWDLTGMAEGHCINTTVFFYFTSSFNIVTDVWILLLPIKTLRSINRPNREKVALFVIFGVGTFATIASIVRLHTIYTYTEAVDPFQDSLLVNIWSMIEVNVAIICASVPALKPIFSGTQRRRTREARSKVSGPSNQVGGSDGSKSSSGSRWEFIFSNSKIASKSHKSQSSTDSNNSQSAGMTQVHPAGRAFPPAPELHPSRSMNRMNGASSSESILAYTPMSPPPRGHQRPARPGDLEALGDPGMDSSGPVLVLQK